MTDEHFMRQWNEGHEAFTADLDRKLALLARHLSRRERRLFSIDEPYEDDSANRNATSSILIGLAATVATSTLFLVVALLASPRPIFAYPILA